MLPNPISPADKIVADYVLAIESGSKIDFDAFIAANIEHECELREFFQLKRKLKEVLADDDSDDSCE